MMFFLLMLVLPCLRASAQPQLAGVSARPNTKAISCSKHPWGKTMYVLTEDWRIHAYSSALEQLASVNAKEALDSQFQAPVMPLGMWSFGMSLVSKTRCAEILLLHVAVSGSDSQSAVDDEPRHYLVLASWPDLKMLTQYEFSSKPEPPLVYYSQSDEFSVSVFCVVQDELLVLDHRLKVQDDLQLEKKGARTPILVGPHWLGIPFEEDSTVGLYSMNYLRRRGLWHYEWVRMARRAVCAFVYVNIGDTRRHQYLPDQHQLGMFINVPSGESGKSGGFQVVCTDEYLGGTQKDCVLFRVELAKKPRTDAPGPALKALCLQDRAVKAIIPYGCSVLVVSLYKPTGTLLVENVQNPLIQRDQFSDCACETAKQPEHKAAAASRISYVVAEPTGQEVDLRRSLEADVLRLVDFAVVGYTCDSKKKIYLCVNAELQDLRTDARQFGQGTSQQRYYLVAIKMLQAAL